MVIIISFGVVFLLISLNNFIIRVLMMFSLKRLISKIRIVKILFRFLINWFCILGLVFVCGWVVVCVLCVIIFFYFNLLNGYLCIWVRFGKFCWCRVL